MAVSAWLSGQCTRAESRAPALFVMRIELVVVRRCRGVRAYYTYPQAPKAEFARSIWTPIGGWGIDTTSRVRLAPPGTCSVSRVEASVLASCTSVKSQTCTQPSFKRQRSRSRLTAEGRGLAPLTRGSEGRRQGRTTRFCANTEDERDGQEGWGRGRS